MCAKAVFFLASSACISAICCNHSDHLWFGTRTANQLHVQTHKAAVGWGGLSGRGREMWCRTVFHLLLCFMCPGAVCRGIQTRTTNGSDTQPGDIKPTKAVPFLGSYLFKVLLFGSSCSPTSVIHGCVSNHWY